MGAVYKAIMFALSLLLSLRKGRFGSSKINGGYPWKFIPKHSKTQVPLSVVKHKTLPCIPTLCCWRLSGSQSPLPQKLSSLPNSASFTPAIRGQNDFVQKYYWDVFFHIQSGFPYTFIFNT